MLPEPLVALLTTLGGSSADALRRSLLTPTPVQRAIRAVTNLRPTMRRQLAKALRGWLADDAVLQALNAVRAGIAPAEATTAMVEAFVDHSRRHNIIDLRRDDAESIVSEFWDHFTLAISQTDIAIHRLENITRSEGMKTRDAIQEIKSAGSYLNSLRPQVVQAAAVGNATAEDHQWHDQVDNANRLLAARKVRSALTTYRQILEDVTHTDATSSINFRLNANIGTCLLLLGEWQEAETHFKKARDFAPDNALPFCQLAQIELHRGRHEEASYYAKQAISRDPEDASAWLIRLQSEPLPDVDTVPTHVQNEALYHMIRAKRAFDRGDYGKAAQLAAEALVNSDRSAMELIDIAEMLYVANAARTLSDPGQIVREDVVVLCSEAIESLEDAEWPGLAARALTIRGICRAPDEPHQARADLHSALTLAPHDVGPHVALADVLLMEARIDDALRILDRVPGSARDVRVAVLRARALAYRDPTDPAIEQELRAALALLPTGVDMSPLLLDLVDVATRAQLTTLATEVLGELQVDRDSTALRVLRGRLAAAGGDRQTAERDFRAALDLATAEEAPQVASEFAAFLTEGGSHQAAADVLSAAGVIEGPDHLHPLYAGVLMAANRWSALAELIRRYESTQSLPPWALDAGSTLALQLDDLETATRYLTELQAHEPSASGATVRLAYTLLRAGKTSDALSELAKLPATNLTPDECEGVVQLYFHAEAFEESVRVAYRFWRVAPTRRSEMLLVMVFLASPPSLKIFQDPERVAADTSVHLRDVHGKEELSFTITTGPTLSGQHNELQVNENEAKLLLEKTVGESVTLRPNDYDPIEYRIVKIVPALVTVAQEAMQRLATHPSDDNDPVQAVRIGAPDSVRFFAPTISMLHQREAMIKELLRLYHEHRFPLGWVAQRTGLSARDVYLHLTSMDDEACYVESGVSESLQLADQTARETEEVIVSVSALLTLQRLELLDLLPRMYEEVLAPPSLLVELRRLQQAAKMNVHREKVGWMTTGSTGLELIETPVAAVEREYTELRHLVTFVSETTTPVLRRLETLGEQREALCATISEAETDALLATAHGYPLYADDAGLRALAAAEYDSSSFSTHAFLGAACDRGLLSGKEWLEATARLVRWGHTFVPIVVTLPYAAFKADGQSLGPHLRAVLRRVTAPPTPEEGIRVAAYFVAQMVKADVEGAPFQAVVWHTLDLVYREPDRTGKLQRFNAAVADCLRVSPFSYRRYANERRAFLFAKGNE